MPSHPLTQPDWIDEAPIQVEQTIDIDAAPDAVWPHIADHEAWPEWFTDLDQVHRIGEGAGVGSGRRVVVKKLTLDEEFTAWDESERFAFAVVKSPIPVLARMAEDITLAPSDAGGTTVTYRQGLEGRRFVGGVMALMWKQGPAQVANALSNLKQRVESA